MTSSPDPETPPKRPRKPVRIAEIRGAAKLITRSSLGITRMAEGVHRHVWNTMGIPGGTKTGRTRGLTGLIYSGVHGSLMAAGLGVDAVLAGLQPLLENEEIPAAPHTPQREAILSALNGFMGDQLAAHNNPLATPMILRHAGNILNWQTPPASTHLSGKVLLLVHGLCMNDLQWDARHNGQSVNHGKALAAALNYTPIYARYNSGLHVSQNGRALSAQLEQLARHWPTPIDELTVVAHSMGGLVIRSALHHATQDGLRWPAYLKKIVFLGTPHHGSPLERAGAWVDERMGSMAYTAPFVPLGQMRSAGITDLRFGNLLDADWQGSDRFARLPDTRQIVPLPTNVACFTVAATTADKRGILADRLIGDGLVPLHSALGHHDDPRRSLIFPASAQLIAYRTSHMALLSSPDITRQMVDWLTPQDGDRENEC